MGKFEVAETKVGVVINNIKEVIKEETTITFLYILT